MIVVQARMWPDGNPVQAHEVLNVTLTDRTSPGDPKQSWFAHVLARPKPFEGVPGYEADVEVQDVNPRGGFVPLLMAVLGSAHVTEQHEGIMLPPSRQLARIELVDAVAFEELLRKGV